MHNCKSFEGIFENALMVRIHDFFQIADLNEIVEKRLFRTFRLRVQRAANIVDKVQGDWKGEQGVETF